MIGKREMQKITITEKLIRNENEAIEAIKANNANQVGIRC